MALYSNINLFFIKLLTIVVPRFLHGPCALFWGGLFYLVLPKARRSVRKNLRVVMGRERVEGLVFSTFYKFSRNWCDQMLMMRLRGDRLLGLIGRWTTEKPLNDALAAGRGAILMSIHLGNWELGGLGLADKGYRMNVLTFREPDEKVNAQREVIRRERGINFIYVDREASSLAIVEAVSALNRNEVLAILGDRDGSSHTGDFNFFGRPTPIPLGAAYLAIATGAPVIPVFVPMEGERYAAIMEEPVFFPAGDRSRRDQVIREKTAELVGIFERYIKTYPDQWYNFFDYWGTEKAAQQKEL